MAAPVAKSADGVIHCLSYFPGIESVRKKECPNELAWKEENSNRVSRNFSEDIILVILTFNCNDKTLKI